MADHKEYIVRVYKGFKTEFFNKDLLLHREDGPAVEFFNGTKYWYKDGKLHREDGPAIEDELCCQDCWYKNGLRFIRPESPRASAVG